MDADSPTRVAVRKFIKIIDIIKTCRSCPLSNGLALHVSSEYGHELHHNTAFRTTLLIFDHIKSSKVMTPSVVSRQLELEHLRGVRLETVSVHLFES